MGVMIGNDRYHHSHQFKRCESVSFDDASERSGFEIDSAGKTPPTPAESHDPTLRQDAKDGAPAV